MLTRARSTTMQAGQAGCDRDQEWQRRLGDRVQSIVAAHRVHADALPRSLVCRDQLIARTPTLGNPIAIVTAQCCYHFFNVIDGGAEPFAFRDLDGEMLAEYRTFPTLEAAKAWVDEDADRRHGKRGAPHDRIGGGPRLLLRA
jgi:hypothetical protein